MKKVLILGGTGMLGAPVVRQMRADGYEVRLLARDTKKAKTMLGTELEIIAGDVTNLAVLEKAMAGCDGVHISVGGPVDLVSAENAAALSAKLGLERIIYVSGSTVSEKNAWFPMTAQKIKAETAVKQSGVPYTILRPTWPMEQLPRLVREGRATVVGAVPLPWHWFAATDMAHMVSSAFGSEAAINKCLYVHGPEAITMVEALERYCHAFHPEIESVTVMPIEVARQVAEASGNNMLKMFAELMDYFEKVGEPGDPKEANELLGAPTTTLEDWIVARKQATTTAVA